MNARDQFPFKGQVIWLTSEQGGRRSPPDPSADHDYYAATAFIPPFTADTGLASFAIRAFDPAALRSPAEGRWLMVENRGDQAVVAGSVAVITEGQHVVACFHVERVVEVST